MKLTLAIVSATPELFACAVDHASRHARGDFDIVAFGNGCDLSDVIGALDARRPVEYRQTDDNKGVPYALHELWKLAAADPTPAHEHIVAYIHDDVDLMEDGWDQRVLCCFQAHPECGLVGFGGATALGGDEIYKAAYEIHQLGRRNFYSNMVGAEIHGERRIDEMPIVFTDGFSMILRRSLLDKISGWSWWPFDLVHHAYDYGIACQARRHGFSAWLVPCAVNHKGGMTATRAVHQEMAKRYGGDSAVHAAAHLFVYDQFRDVYPLRLK